MGRPKGSKNKKEPLSPSEVNDHRIMSTRLMRTKSRLEKLLLRMETEFHFQVVMVAHNRKRRIEHLPPGMTEGAKQLLFSLLEAPREAPKASPQEDDMSSSSSIVIALSTDPAIPTG